MKMQRRACLCRALIGALGVLAASVWLVTSAYAQAATARTSVAVPAVRRGNVVMLDVSIKAQYKAGGNLGGVVRLQRPGGVAIEVGRFSVFGSGEQSYQFNVTGVLPELGAGLAQAEVEVQLLDRISGAPASGALSISRAEIVTR